MNRNAPLKRHEKMPVRASRNGGTYPCFDGAGNLVRPFAPTDADDYHAALWAVSGPWDNERKVCRRRPSKVYLAGGDWSMGDNRMDDVFRLIEDAAG